MTEDELFEDVKYWKGRADAAEARLAEALEALKPFAAQAECWPDLQDNQAVMTSDGIDLSSIDLAASDLRRAHALVGREQQP